MTQVNKRDLADEIDEVITCIKSFIKTMLGKNPWEFGTDTKGRCDVVVSVPSTCKVIMAKIEPVVSNLVNPQGDKFTSQCKLVFVLDNSHDFTICYELYEDALNDLNDLQTMM